MKQFHIDKFLHFLRNQESPPGSAPAGFLKRIETITKFVSLIEASTNDSKIINEAYKNGIVNTVTALEVFLKDIIIEYSAKWKKEGVAELMDIKISLKEAFTLFKEKNIREEYVVTHAYSFQNIDSIAMVFNKLLGANLFKAIEDFFDDSSELKLLEKDENGNNWIGQLEVLLKKRHEIIHEGRDYEITSKEFETYLATSGRFMAALILFLILKDGLNLTDGGDGDPGKSWDEIMKDYKEVE